ncbi:MAG: AMP-binding protein, partial [bacterium]|nr:AMP-binding protein [bacterium]
MDKYQNLVPVGTTGEICVGGEGVGRGYINRPRLTGEKFVRNPRIPGQRLYRSGDSVRMLPNGEIEYLGRIDQQVKIRGFRIELGEIESRLLTHPGIKEALVLEGKITGTGTGEQEENYLCAYVVAGKGKQAETPDTAALREYLSQTLPDYMIPAYFTRLEEIPLTPNGKVDKKALPVPEVKSEKEYAVARNTTEAKLVEIWTAVLFAGNTRHSPIGIDDKFFQLGGHSLKAIVMIAKIGKDLNVKLPLVEIFRTPDIRGLAMYIEGAAEHKYVSIMPAEKREYYTLSSAQERLYILQRMEPEGIGYNLPQIIPLAEEYSLEKLEETFRKLIKRHESLRTSFHMIKNTPVQKIHDDVEFTIDYYEITGNGKQNEEPEELDEENIVTLVHTEAPMTGAEKASNIINSFTRPFE